MKKFIGILLLFVNMASIAQNNESKDLESFGKIDLGLSGINITYELPLSDKFVWDNSLGIGMGMSADGFNVEYIMDFSRPVPFLKSELKYIYNTEKRIAKGKSILYNSGNFIGLQAKYSFGSANHYSLNSALLKEIHWGIQRSLGKPFLFNMHIGFGYLKDFDNNEGMASLTIGVRFGYKLF